MCRAVDLRGRAGRSRAQDGRSAVALVSTAENDEEGTTKGLVEEGVEDGVEHGVDVAQPEAGCPQLLRNTVVYEGVHHVRDEERGPAQAEAAHDDAQSLGCLGLGAHAVVALVVRAVRVPRSSSPLQHADLSSVCPRRDVDALVRQHHQDQRYVEGHDRAGQCIWLVHHKHTHRGVARELPLLYLSRGECRHIQIKHTLKNVDS